MAAPVATALKRHRPRLAMLIPRRGQLRGNRAANAFSLLTIRQVRHRPRACLLLPSAGLERLFIFPGRKPTPATHQSAVIRSCEELRVVAKHLSQQLPALRLAEPTLI